MNNAIVHTTFKELEFVESLGTNSEMLRMSKNLLLKKYLSAMKKRAYWGDVEANAVRKRVLELINGANS